MSDTTMGRTDHDHLGSFRSEMINVIGILIWRVIGRKTDVRFS